MYTMFLAAAHAEHTPIVPASLMQALGPSITALVVFLLLLIVLRLTVWPKITAGLDDRERKIREEIKAAEDARQQASAALAQYEASLASARDEANKMIVKAKADAKAVADELREKNATDLAEMKTRAMKEIETAKLTAVSELHAQSAALASSIAGRILQREITVQDQQRLVDESLRELNTTRRN